MCDGCEVLTEKPVSRDEFEIELSTILQYLIIICSQLFLKPQCVNKLKFVSPNMSLENSINLRPN